MVGIKGITSDTRSAGNWSGEVGSLALDERLVLVNSVVEDSAGAYKLSGSQLTDGRLQLPYELAQPRERSPIKAVAVYYNK